MIGAVLGAALTAPATAGPLTAVVDLLSSAHAFLPSLPEIIAESVVDRIASLIDDRTIDEEHAETLVHEISFLTPEELKDRQQLGEFLYDVMYVFPLLPPKETGLGNETVWHDDGVEQNEALVSAFNVLTSDRSISSIALLSALLKQDPKDPLWQQVQSQI